MEITTTREVPAFWDNDYYEKVRQRTLKVIACIPPEKYDWTYREGKFSFADIIRHLAMIERYMYAENAQFKPSSYPGHGRELADGPENVLKFFDAMHAESMEIFGRLSDDDLKKKCVTPGGTSITVWKWLRAMVEHEVHHRAQIYIYLGMLGIATPPIYGLTSEEVKERSTKDRLRNSFNISIAEIEVTDLWQRATLGAVSISDSRDYLEGLMQNVERAAVRLANNAGAEVVDSFMDYVEG